MLLHNFDWFYKRKAFVLCVFYGIGSIFWGNASFLTKYIFNFKKIFLLSICIMRKLHFWGRVVRQENIFTSEDELSEKQVYGDKLSDK